MTARPVGNRELESEDQSQHPTTPGGIEGITLANIRPVIVMAQHLQAF